MATQAENMKAANAAIAELQRLIETSPPDGDIDAHLAQAIEIFSLAIPTLTVAAFGVVFKSLAQLQVEVGNRGGNA